MLSINLTIHNKAGLLNQVLNGIFLNTRCKFELICVLDGCTDESETILTNYLFNNKIKNLCHFNILKAPDVFEVCANNIAAKASSGDYIAIIQDDCVISEYGWDDRILRPFEAFDDVFAVSGNCAHNWELNQQSNDIHDLMYRMHKKLGKVCGYYGIDFISKPEWGGTRDGNGFTKPFVYAANHKNARLLYERHAEEMKVRTIENRHLV